MTDIAAALDAIDQRAQAATAGPWKLWGMAVMADQDGTGNVATAVDVAQTFYRDEHGKPRTFDAEFIAAAREDVPALVAGHRAVLARHAPSVIAMPAGHDDRRWCYECDDEFPCGTVRDLARPLGVTT